MSSSLSNSSPQNAREDRSTTSPKYVAIIKLIECGTLNTSTSTTTYLTMVANISLELYTRNL